MCIMLVDSLTYRFTISPSRVLTTILMFSEEGLFGVFPSLGLIIFTVILI